MRILRLLGAAIFITIVGLPAADSGRSLVLRSRVELFRGSGQWNEVQMSYAFHPARSALIVCDMWDKHWCGGANVRVAALAKKLEPILEDARRNGVIIVHAPSDTMSFYAAWPQRQRMLSLPAIVPPKDLALNSPPLPIDDSGGGCDTAGDREHRVWTCEHPTLKVAAYDYISDSGQEIYNLLRSRNIETVFYTGVHTNMCILNRTFAIKQMTKWGVHCVLLRDFTDAMYAPQDLPHVSHKEGTELVVQYIEKYWCPTALSEALLGALH